MKSGSGKQKKCGAVRGVVVFCKDLVVVKMIGIFIFKVPPEVSVENLTNMFLFMYIIYMITGYISCQARINSFLCPQNHHVYALVFQIPAEVWHFV